MVINTNINDLKTGDLIVISLSGNLFLGIYLGRGRGTVQFYTLDQLLRWTNYKGQKPKYPYKDYMGGRNISHRVIKYNPDLIEDKKIQEDYYVCMEFLRSLKIIK